MAAANATTYTQYYQQVPDILGGQYAAFLDLFGPESGVTPAVLRDQVLDNGQTVPKVFVYMTEAPTPVVRVLFRVTRVAPIWGVATPFENHQAFAFASDVEAGNQVSLVHFPTGAAGTNTDAPFECRPMTTVPTLVVMGNAWVTAAGADCVGPFVAGAADTEDIRARRLAPVPQLYAPLVLGRTFTAQQFWDTVIAQIIADGNGAMCTTLVNWARVASTYRPPATGAPGPVVPDICIVAPLAPVMDANLRREVWTWMSTDLPALVTNTTGLNQHLTNMTTELSTNRTESAATHNAAALAAAAKLTLSGKYPNVSQMLHRICLVTNDAAMPPFWQVFPTVHKSELLPLLQSACDAHASNHTHHFPSPLITPEVIETVKNFQFGSRDPDDMMAGLNACLIVLGDAATVAGARSRTQTYHMVVSQHANADMAQLRELILDSPLMPWTVWQSKTTMEYYSILADVLFGEMHPKAVAQREFALAYGRICGLIEATYTPSEIPPLLPLIMRAHQLEMYRYTNDLKQNGATATPVRYTRLIGLIEGRQWALLPQLPRHYFNLQ